VEPPPKRFEFFQVFRLETEVAAKSQIGSASLNCRWCPLADLLGAERAVGAPEMIDGYTGFPGRLCLTDVAISKSGEYPGWNCGGGHCLYFLLLDVVGRRFREASSFRHGSLN
jgi:hypothetical protein